jgi:hypothetical protein
MVVWRSLDIENSRSKLPSFGRVRGVWSSPFAFEGEGGVRGGYGVLFYLPLPERKGTKGMVAPIDATPAFYNPE